MDIPLLHLFLFTVIGVIIGTIAVAAALVRLLKQKPTGQSFALISAVIYFVPLMTKPIYAFILTLVSQNQPTLTGNILTIAGILFGLVAATQGLLGAAFIRPLPNKARTETLFKTALHLMIMGAIETVATMTMIFSIILSNMRAQ